ncbi:MAG: MFS transporter [Pseudomonadota bacterium]
MAGSTAKTAPRDAVAASQDETRTMIALGSKRGTSTNIALYPWFKFFQNLTFWQAVWFLYFQNTLSAADALVLYAIYDLATTVFEVPSGYMSDRLGRRRTLVAAAATGLIGAMLLVAGEGFAVFALGQILIGASTALSSGTDSALLYESLAAEGREHEVERQEIKAWRYNFVALAVSAVAGGGLFMVAQTWPFVAAAIASAVMLIIALGFREPPRARAAPGAGGLAIQLETLRLAFSQPVLLWLLVLSVAIYVFSHLTFVIAQPFILESLQGTGTEADTPLIAGLVSAAMMAVSVAASLWAPDLRARIGLSGILLSAFALQVGLIAVLAATNEIIAIGVLLLRMVPNAFSRPFILARIQPVLADATRATYVSLQSFAGRLILAIALYVASFSSSGDGAMSYAEIQQILGWFVAAGLVCLGAMALAARRIAIDPSGT